MDIPEGTIGKEKKKRPVGFIILLSLAFLSIIFIAVAHHVSNLQNEFKALQDKHIALLNQEKGQPTTIDQKIENPLNVPEIVSLADAIIKLQPRTTPFVAKFIAMHILRESKEKGLDPDLITAQIWVESEFNPNATSNMKARGLMQVRYEIWKKEPQLKNNGVDVMHKLYWLDANIQSGTDILATFIKEANGDLARALYRYYCGSPALEKGKAPWQHEYVAKILYYYFKIREHRLNGTPIEEEEIIAAPVTDFVPKSAVIGIGMSKSEGKNRP